jgi:DNA-binding Lrp family transcriptional regulator
MASKIDELDQQLITILQKDCQINAKALASMLNISQTPLRLRLKKLKKAGYLNYYVTIDKSKFPNAISANIGISLTDLSENTVDLFEKKMSEIECVTQIQRVSGNLDYQLSLLFKDKPEKDDFLLNRINKVPGIKLFDCVDVVKEVHQGKFRML